MPTTRIVLEVPVTSVEDALAARECGADRLELCAALELGGLTPSAGLVLAARQRVAGPLIVMARPRPGGFCYGATEWDVLYRDAALALDAGADGIAFGALTDTGEIDEGRVASLVRLIGPQEAVFHRAFDLTPRPEAALERLVTLGVRRVMTSGQAATAAAGAGRLKQLVAQAAGRIEVLAAGGIRTENVRELLARTGCTQVHASLRTPRGDPSALTRPHVRFGRAEDGEGHYGATCGDLVREMREALDG
jgi:copper homeostasis protein